MVLQCTVHLSAANLLCQSTGDNSNAIGGQLSPLTSGSGVKWNRSLLSLHIGLCHLMLMPGLTFQGKILILPLL